MPHLTSRMMAVLFLTMLIFLAFPACVTPSSADTQIHIAGIDPASAYPNETVHLYGDAATPNSAVTAILAAPSNQIYATNITTPWIVLGGSNLTLGSNFSSPTGDWQIDFLTPSVLPTCYRVVVFDNISLTNDSVSLCILINATIGTYYPELNFTYGPGNIIMLTPNVTGLPLLFYIQANVTPSLGPAGTFVTIYGRYASGRQITVYFENTKVATVNELPAGDWSISFQVPNVSEGNYTIRAIDVEGRWMSVTSFVVTAPLIVPIVSMILSPVLVAAVVVLGAFSGAVMLMFIVFFHRKRRAKHNVAVL